MGVWLCQLDGGWDKNQCRPLYWNSTVKSPTWQRLLAGLVRFEDAACYRLFTLPPLGLSLCLSIAAGGSRFSITPSPSSLCIIQFVFFPPAHFAALFICLQLLSSLSLSDYASLSPSLSPSLTHTHTHETWWWKCNTHLCSPLGGPTIRAAEMKI